VSNESSFCSSSRGDDPLESSFNRANSLVHLVSIKAEACLQSKGVSGTKTAGFDTVRSEELTELGCFGGLDGYFEAVLAGVAASGKEGIDIEGFDFVSSAFHEELLLEGKAS